jgi:hypothetical protein
MIMIGNPDRDPHDRNLPPSDGREKVPSTVRAELLAACRLAWRVLEDFARRPPPLDDPRAGIAADACRAAIERAEHRHEAIALVRYDAGGRLADVPAAIRGASDCADGLAETLRSGYPDYPAANAWPEAVQCAMELAEVLEDLEAEVVRRRGAGPVYTIRSPEGLIFADDIGDLGELKDQAARMAGCGHSGTFPVEADRRPWGKLHIVEKGKWEARSDDGTTVVTPSAFIL